MDNIYKNLNYEYKSEKYENEDFYVGEFKNGIREGFGIKNYNKHDIEQRERYEGQWKDGKGNENRILKYINFFSK